VSFLYDFSVEVTLAFRLVRVRYDHESERAYVELWDEDDDGGEQIATAIFSYGNKEKLAKREMQQRSCARRDICSNALPSVLSKNPHGH
jgi:hypothetical protein